jgi:Tripartite tricarboxylate transporter family receptor
MSPNWSIALHPELPIALVNSPAYSGHGTALRDAAYALAVDASQRLPSLPDGPNVAMSGAPSLACFGVHTTYGILALRGTPDAVVTELSALIRKERAVGRDRENVRRDGGLRGLRQAHLLHRLPL